MQTPFNVDRAIDAVFTNCFLQLPNVPFAVHDVSVLQMVY